MANKYRWRETATPQNQQTTQPKYRWRESNAQNTATDITNRLNSWLKNYEGYVSDYQTRFGNRKGTYEDAYVSDSAAWLENINKQKSDFAAEADSILSDINKYQDYLDKDWVKSVQKTLAGAIDQQNQIANIAAQDDAYWESFGTEDMLKQYGSAEGAYKAKQQENADYEEKSQANLSVLRQEIAELEKATQEYATVANQYNAFSNRALYGSEEGRALADKYNALEDLNKQLQEKRKYYDDAKFIQDYASYMENAKADNFGVDSQFNSTRTEASLDDATYMFGNTFAYDTSVLFGDFLYDYVNKQKDAVAVAKQNNVADMSALTGYNTQFLETLTNDEIRVFNYLYKTKSPESAKAFLDFLEADLEGRRRVKEQAFYAQQAEESPFKMSVISTLMAPLKGVSYLGQAMDMMDDGKLKENAGYNRLSYIPSTIRSQVASTIENGKWGKVGSFAYNTGMSMADFLFTTAVSGGNQALSLAIMGTGAAADATLAAKDRGLSDGQAFALGTIAGLAEIAMEKISLGAWLNGDMTEGALKYWLSNTFSEGLEETGTSAINLLADVIIAGDKSEWKTAMQDYIDRDIAKNKAEAFGLVAADQAKQMGLDALGGMLSGSTIGGGTYAGASISANFQYGGLAKNNAFTTSLTTEGVKLNPDSKYIQKLNTKAEKGKNLTGMQVRNILAANQDAITANDMQKIQQAAEKRLTDLGQTKDVSKVAELATKYATGQKLTRAETSILSRSEYGSKVAHDLLQDSVVQEVNAENYGSKAIRSVLDKMASATYTPLDDRVGDKRTFKVSEDKQATDSETGDKVNLGGAEVVSIGKDGMTLKVDGKEVKASDIEYASGDQSYLYEAVSKIENITPEAATAIINGYDLNGKQSVSAYLNGIDEAYQHGYYGYDKGKLKETKYASKLTKEQSDKIYEIGRNASKSSTESADAAKKNAGAKQTEQEKAEKLRSGIEGNNTEVYYWDGKNIVKFDKSGKKYDAKRMAAVNTAKFLSKLGIGGKFYFYESYMKDGVRVYKDLNGNEVAAPNGIYMEKDGSIHIDLNAGNRGQGTALFTLGHELTHFIKDQSKQQFKTLSDLVAEAFDKTDLSMHERVLAKQKFLENKYGEPVSYSLAHEEVMADSLSTMLSDGSFYDLVMEIKVKDKGLFRTIKLFFKHLVEKFTGEYAKLTPDQRDAQDIRQMKDMFDKIQKTFAEALVEASDNFQAKEVKENTTEDGGVKYMVRENVVDTNGNVYDKVVKPGLTVYQKVKHSKQSYVSYLHSKIFKRTFNLRSNDGADIKVEFAKDNDRIKKDGDKTPRRVLGELEATTDRLKMIAIINIKDILKNSEPLAPSNENSHQWLDAEGWNDRISYMEDNDVIYPVILHIPKTRDGRYLLYDLSVIKDEGSTVDIDATALAAQSARAPETTENGLQSAVKSIEPSGDRVSQPEAEVKKNSDRDFSDAQFSLREPVEESKDLLAYHNITLQLLLDVLSRKSLLMPSLAITNKGMTDFGAISLLFDKATIDPIINALNKLYGSDAWTPTQTKLKKNAKFDTDKTVNAVNSIKNSIGSKYVSDLFNITAKQFRDSIIKADGSIYDAYAHNIGVQTAYAMEKGIISEIPTKNGSVDKTALQKQLNSELDTDNGWRQYKRWLNNISDTIITSYDQATNEDILKNMKAQPATAKQFKLSETGELVVPAVEYSSIDEVRKNKNRLSENAAEATKAVAAEFLSLAKKIGNTQQVVDAINASFGSRYSVADIVRSFNAKGIKITTETAGELQALYKKAVELPTQYFEAKPGREVGLDEIKAVVMPTGTEHAELKSKLEDLGIQVVEYDGSNESRVEALNSMENLKFSDRDSNGNQLSKEQQAFFEKSTVRDEHGRLLVMYHGTPNGGFTKFRSGTYFTQNAEYADVYQNPGASSISTKNGADAPMTYEVYLNIRKPFDTRNPKERRIFMEEFYRKYGTGTPLADSGLPDWIDGMDLQEFIEDMGYDYDGLILDEGGVGGYGDEVKNRGFSYVVFSPDQVKDVNNKQPTSNPDYRYSERGSYAEIQEERQKLYQRERDLMERKRVAENDPELLQAMDDYSALFDEARTLFAKRHKGTATQAELNRIEEITALREDRIKHVSELQKSLGLGEMEQEMYNIRAEKEALRIAADEAWEREGAEKEKKDIEKAGISAPEYFRKKALKAFKTTTNFNEAGYLLPDGKLLNFSGGERNHRYRDHREIGEIYEATQGAAALNRFLADGNIRIMAESPGIDLSSIVEPTREQYAAIKKFVNLNGVKDGQFFVDFSDADGHRAGNYSYEGNVNADRVVNDIKYFFEKGEVREQSSVARFLNSERGEDTSNRALLANAFETISKSSVEYKDIQEYRKQIKVLNLLENELSELNSQIHEIRFTKGKYDAQKLKALEQKAERIAADITRQDKVLFNMEASAPLRKVIEFERKKAAKQTKEHIAEIVKTKAEKMQQKELRHKIRKTLHDLNKLLNKGDKKKNVKQDMQGFVSKALELADFLFTDHISNDDLIRMGITVDLKPAHKKLVKETEDILSYIADNYGSITAEKYAELDAKKKKNVERLQDVLKAQRNKALETPVYTLFDDLVTAYANLQNSSQEAVKAAYNPNTEMFLKSYMGVNEDGTTDTDRKSFLQNMRVADMTTEELEHLLYAYKMVLHTVKTANKLFVEGKSESIDQITERLMKDFSKHKAPEGETKIAIRNIANKIGWSYEKLYYALDRIGSEAFTELVMNIANSENTVMQDVMEAVAFRDEIVNKYGFNNWKINKEIDREFLDNNGKKFKLTLGQLMSLYAYSRRKGAWDHIKYGGFSFKDAKLTNPKPADSYKLTKDQCKAITDLLTAEQKAYVEDMQKFLSETMGEKGNEVSMLLYGIKLFGEENYFPIHIDGRFMANANESQAKAAAGFGTMSNAGFTHAQNPKAKAPFLLESFNDVWADHVNEMSRYHGTVPALEDFRRVMNRASYMESSTESQSMYAALENHFGKAAADYFRNLYQEANSGAITDKMQGLLKKFLSLFRKTSVAYKASVWIQQPSAIARAYAMIDRKYFGYKGVGALPAGVVKTATDRWTKAQTKAYNEMLKYAPGVTMAKEIGGFDTHTGSSIREYLLDTKRNLGFFKRIGNKWKTGNAIEKGKAVMDMVDNNAIANLPSLTDKIAWIEIWNACKRETVAKHKDLATNSEEFMQAVGKRFTEVIRATQVYDSMFSKSPMLKSKNLAVQYLVSFMNEPNTTANMVEKAVRDAINGDWKGGLRTAGAVTSSIVLNNILKAIVYAMRDEDEDETYIEKYVASVTGGLVADFIPFNYVPLARDIWSIWQGYDVERPDMSIVADAINEMKALGKLKSKDIEDMTEEEIEELDKQITSANWSMVGTLAAVFGVPLKNVYTEVRAIYNQIRIAANNAGMTTPDSVWDKVKEEIANTIPFLAKETKTEKLYDAIVSGDTKYIERIKGTYKTDNSYQSAVRKALRENDSRIHDAAQAKIDGNTEEYKRIFKEIRKEDIFSYDEIRDAINSEENKILKKTEPEKATSDYSATSYIEAIADGDEAAAETAKEDIIDAKVANGKSRDVAEREFKSSLTTAVQDVYSTGLLDDAQAKNMLMEYAGKDEEEADSYVSYWSYLDDHSEYEKYSLTKSNVEKYLEFAEPENIPMDVFVQYRDKAKGIEDIKDEYGDVAKSAWKQKVDIIDSLPLTDRQKDAMYLAAGLPESKSWDVPW